MVMRHPYRTYMRFGQNGLCEDAPTCIGQWAATWMYTLMQLQRGGLRRGPRRHSDPTQPA